MIRKKLSITLLLALISVLFSGFLTTVSSDELVISREAGEPSSTSPKQNFVPRKRKPKITKTKKVRSTATKKTTAVKETTPKKSAGTFEKGIIKSKPKTERDLVEILLEDGKRLYKKGDYEGALLKYRQAEKIEPNNIKILKLIKEVKEAQMNIDLMRASIEKELIDKERIIDVEEVWSTEQSLTPIGKPGEKRPYSLETIEKKAQIKLASCNFNNANIRDVITYLTDLSGINIVLDETAITEPMNVTVHLKDFTVVDALEVVLRTKGLSYRIEENLIWISNRANLSNEDLATKIYKLSYGLGSLTTFTTFDTVTTPSAIKSNEIGVTGIPYMGVRSTVSTNEGVLPPSNEIGLLPPTTLLATMEGVKIGGAGGVAGNVTVTMKDVIVSCVSWPEGSRIFQDNRTSTLIIRNTPSNHAIIEKILSELDVPPLQIMIEAKFVEIDATDLKNIGINWTPQISGSGAARPSTFPFERSTSGGDYLPLSESSSDFPPDPGAGFPYATANDFTFGVLDFSQFQVVMNALETDSRSNLLSAPKVTTINGQEAVIKVVREYIYPTSYDTQSAEYNASGVKVKDSTTTPSNFKTRDIGIILKVTPVVGEDEKTINLTLTPEVSEIGEWKNYGTASAPIEQPFFDSRRATTSLVINNGDTIVMGGLIKEDHTKEENKVPLLGDIPLLGGIFKRSYDRKEKRNLMIFVTAYLLPPKEKI